MNTATCIYHDGRNNFQVNYGGTKEQAIDSWRGEMIRREVSWSRLFCERTGEILASYRNGNFGYLHSKVGIASF